VSRRQLGVGLAALDVDVTESTARAIAAALGLGSGGGRGGGSVELWELEAAAARLVIDDDGGGGRGSSGVASEVRVRSLDFFSDASADGAAESFSDGTAASTVSAAPIAETGGSVPAHGAGGDGNGSGNDGGDHVYRAG